MGGKAIRDACVLPLDIPQEHEITFNLQGKEKKNVFFFTKL